MRAWLGLMIGVAALTAQPAAAMPSGIPNDGGARIVEGAPFVEYSALVAAMPAWQAHYVELTRQFAPFDQELQQYRAISRQMFTERDALAAKADGATGPARATAQAELKAVDARVHETSVAFNACEALVSNVYSKREDALLNPLAPALIAALEQYARGKNLPRVLVLSSTYAQAARGKKMRDVTAEFVAWRKTRGN